MQTRRTLKKGAFSGKILFSVEAEDSVVSPAEKRLKQLVLALRQRKRTLKTLISQTLEVRQIHQRSGIQKRKSGGLLARLFGAEASLYREVEREIQQSQEHLYIASNKEENGRLRLKERRLSPDAFYLSPQAEKTIQLLEAALLQYGFVQERFSTAFGILNELSAQDSLPEVGPMQAEDAVFTLPADLKW